MVYLLLLAIDMPILLDRIKEKEKRIERGINILFRKRKVRDSVERSAVLAVLDATNRWADVRR